MNAVVDRADIVASLEESVATTQRVLRSPNFVAAVAAVARVIASALQAGNKVVTFGNGGSAAQAEHFVAELGGRMLRDRASLPAVALTTNTALLTALANDYGYEQVFSRQLSGLAQPGDVAFAISTSGESPNVLTGVKTAHKMGLATVGLTGAGGKLGALVDYCISIPAVSTPRIQEAHLLTAHILCEAIERTLFGDAPATETRRSAPMPRALGASTIRT